jgi:hypothetical protein
VRKTIKMHNFLNNVFHLIYAGLVLNKWQFYIRRGCVQAAYSISLCIFRVSLVSCQGLDSFQGAWWNTAKLLV